MNKSYIVKVFYLFLFGIVISINSLFAQDNNVNQSIYPLRPNDHKAVYLTKDNFNVAANGVGDDAQVGILVPDREKL